MVFIRTYGIGINIQILTGANLLHKNNEIVYESSWMKIEKENNKYKLIYDTGDHIGTIDEIEITKEEAAKAQQGDDAAYQVIIKYQNERIRGDF